MAYININIVELKCDRQTLRVTEDNMFVILGWHGLCKQDKILEVREVTHLTASQFNTL